MKIASSLKKKYYSKNVLLFEWILAATVGMFVFSMTAYPDLKSLTVWSTNVWDVTIDSNIFHVYEYSAENIYNAPHKYFGSELLSVLPWSIWNLPIWIAQRFFDIIIVESPLSLAWSKLFLVVLTAVILKYTYKICMLLTNDENKSKWAAFLSASSLFTYISVCYSGQNDVLMVTTSVIAVYYLLKGNRKAFYIISALAIAIKPFYLIAYLSVILLDEKRFLRIFGKALIGMSGIIIQKLAFLWAPMYKESIANGPTGSMLADMFIPNIKTSFGSISLFAVALVVVFFYAYTRKLSKEKQLYGKYVIYIITATYMFYLLFSDWSFYRIFIIVPFVYILFMQNEEMFKYNVLLDTAMSVGLLYFIIMRGSPLFRMKDTNYSLMQRAFGFRIRPKTLAHESIGGFFTGDLEYANLFTPLFSGVAFIAAVLILVINHPREKIQLPAENGDKCPRVVFWIRMLLIVPFMFIMLFWFVGATGRIF